MIPFFQAYGAELTTKTTVVLAAFWLSHLVLARSNPRWRVALWRVATLAMLVLLVVVWSPPIIQLRILNAAAVTVAQSSVGHSDVNSTDRNRNEFSLSQNPAAHHEVRLTERDAEEGVRPSTSEKTAPASTTSRPEPANTGVMSGESTGSKLLTQASWSFSQIDWRTWALVLYVSVAAGLILRLVLGLAYANRFVRAAAEASPRIYSIVAEFAGQLSCGIPFVRVTDRLQSPALLGSFSSRTVLLPKAMSESTFNEQELRGAIAHELAHVAGNDLAWDFLIAVIASILWPHPLTWRMRSVHRAACERVCDRLAANCLGDKEAYKAVLARAALRISGATASIGLAMTRRADVCDRLQALDLNCGVYRLGSQAWSMAAIALLAVTSLGVGSLAPRLSEAAVAALEAAPVEPAPARNDKREAGKLEAPPARPDSLQFKVMRSDNDQPVAGASVSVYMYDAKPNVNKKLVTDDQGVATFPYPDGVEPVFLWAMVHQPGLVPYYVNFGRNLVPAALPTSKLIRMEPGKKIGGTIVDPSGNPVAGANLSILVPAKDTPMDIHYHLLEHQTDDSGKWELDGAPRSFSGLSLRVEHRKFMKTGFPIEDSIYGRYVLDPGSSLRGKVTDTNGKPIANAHITVGRDRWGSVDKPVSVDDDGGYHVPGLKTQNTYVTAEARGFAPKVLPVTIDNSTTPIDFVLEPGQSTRFKLVNEAGEPVVGAWIVADTWKGCRSLWWRDTSDADGLVCWTGAPSEPVTYHLGATDYAAIRDVIVQPREEAHIITLHRILNVHGAVTDWQGNKLPEFRVSIGRKLPGRKEIHWMSHDGSIGRNGQFEIKYNESCDEVFVRVEAPGLGPWISEAIPFAKGDHQASVRLQPTNSLSGIVWSPDGTPAADAQLTLLTESQGMQFTSGYRPMGGKQTVSSDLNGRFDFLPVEDAFLVAAVHENGYAEVTGEELRQAGGVRLKAWAKVEATVRRGNKPLAGAKVAINPNLGPRRIVSVFSYGVSGVTNEEGRVTFDRIVPRDSTIMKTIDQAIGSGTTVYPERSIRALLLPGETTQVEIGGGGATVSGRLAVAGQAPAEHRWSLNEALTIQTDRDERLSAKDQTNSPKYFRGLIGSDGAFEAHDIPPGKYVLRVNVTAVPEPNVCGHGTVLAQISRDFEVAADLRSVDLGLIEGAWTQRLGVGKDAPLFVAEGIGRNSVRLGDLRGQLVVIDFWATWCGPCMAEMPQLLELYKQFSADKRFVLLGLSLDHTLSEATKSVKNNGWPWMFAFAGPGLSSAIPGRYDVGAIPEKFVIDVDGKILYRGRDIAAVAKVVNTRLAELPPIAERRSGEVGIKPIKSNDTFRSDEQIAVALVTSNIQYRTGFSPSLKGPAIVTWSNDGKPCRQIKEIGTSAWLSGPQRLAIDPKRQRLYYCDTFHNRLVALDRSGQERFTSDIPELHAAAVDEKTGDIWCLAARQLHSGELIVVDETGHEKTRHPITAFGINYSPTEDAFWLAGDSISKINRDGKVLGRHLLEEGRYTFTDVAIDRQRGGGWVLELDHPDVPRSKRQLWRISPEGAASVAYEFPEKVLPRTLVCIDGAPWLGAMTNYSRSLTGERQWAVQRFNNEGKPLTMLPFPARDVAVGLATGNIWTITGDELCQIDTEGHKLITIKLPADVESMQVAAF